MCNPAGEREHLNNVINNSQYCRKMFPSVIKSINFLDEMKSFVVLKMCHAIIFSFSLFLEECSSS